MPIYNIPIVVQVEADSLSDAIHMFKGANVAVNLAHSINRENGGAIPKYIDDRDTAKEMSVKMWHIERAETSIWGESTISLGVYLRSTDGGTKIIDETIESPISLDRAEITHEEYGGKGKSQQSILLHVENEEDGAYELQVEVDSSNGTFFEGSLHDWEKSE